MKLRWSSTLSSDSGNLLFEALSRTHDLNNISNGNRLCIVSQSINPYINLGLEEWLLRNSSETLSLMLLYQNKPCIVIGRHQNPWYECKVDKLSDSLSLLRRHSGGGTVYHDLGNVNYVYYSSREAFSRITALDFLCKKLKKVFPVELHSLSPSINHDLFMCNTWKVSGSAYRITSHRAYHHGTMLLQSKLDDLRSFLESSLPRSWFNIGSSTKSRPALVTNLSNYCQELTPDRFIEIVSQDHDYVISMTESEILLLDKIQQIISELQSWDWIFGKTPPFQLLIDNTTIRVDKGKLIDSIHHLESRQQNKFINELNFKHYS